VLFLRSQILSEIFCEVVLTNAHVIYGGLYNSTATSQTRSSTPEQVDEFNKCCMYGSYDRGNCPPQDYAIVPTKYGNIQMETTLDFDGISHKIAYKSNVITGNWRAFTVQFPQKRVFKRGMANGITSGVTVVPVSGELTLKIQPDCGKKFAGPADSGSLVYLLDDDFNVLVPVALHYQTSTDNFSFAIPLWRVFLDIATKQNIVNVKIIFRSPHCKVMDFCRSERESHLKDCTMPPEVIGPDLNFGDGSNTSTIPQWKLATEPSADQLTQPSVQPTSKPSTQPSNQLTTTTTAPTTAAHSYGRYFEKATIS
jgi:hypothetical protein